MAVRRPGGALLVSVGSTLALVAASAAVFAYYGARTSVAVPDTARWFTTDPVYASTIDADGQSVVVTSLAGARGVEAATILPLPGQLYVANQVADHPDSLLWTAVTAARFTNGTHIAVPEMFLASDEGVTQLVGVATLLYPVTFDPPVEVLPADPTEGKRWSQQGTASYGSLELYSYAVDTEVLDVDDHRCVHLRTHTTYSPNEDAESLGATSYDDTAENTVCPGRWFTRSQSATGSTTRAVTAATARRALADFPPPELLGPPATTQGQVPPTRLLLSSRDTGSTGGADTLVVPEARVVLDSDISSNTVTAAVWDQEVDLPMWLLVGEGPTVVAPVGQGSTVVIADTHGTLTAVEAASGFVLWQRSVGRVPMAVAMDAASRYVAVLDKSGAAELVRLVDGESVTTVDAGDDPVGVAVLDGADGPELVVADATSVRGYDEEGDESFHVDETPRAGPVVLEGRAYVGTDDGRLVSIDDEGRHRERYLGEAAVTDLVATRSALALLDDDDHLRLLTPGLAPVARIADDATALTVGTAGGVDTVTTTATDGRITVYDALGAVLRRVRAPLTSEGGAPGVRAAQRAAAVSWDGVVWASAVTGLVRWEAP